MQFFSQFKMKASKFWV